MNFEPCNPPLMDPLYLSGVTLRTDIFKPITLCQQDLKIRLFPEKGSPIRPVPVRPQFSNLPSLSPQPTSPTLNSCSTYTSHNLTNNVTTSSPLNCFITDISRKTSVQSYSAPANTPVQPREISTVPSSITSANSRNIPSVQSYITPVNSRKISPVQYLKKSPRSTPYSPKSSHDSTHLNCSRPVSNYVTTSQSPEIYPQLDANTDISGETSVKSYSTPANTPVQPRETTTVSSSITSANSRKISPVHFSITSAYPRKISPVQSYTTPANLRKISPVQYRKKSPRSIPYSPKSSPDSTPVSHKSDKRRNERHEMSELQSNILKKWFNSYTYLTTVTKAEVSKDTGLPEKTVMYWFQNQRRKVKRETSVNS